jgi:hypothetical protein
LASDATSLQRIEGEPAVPRRTCSHGVGCSLALAGKSCFRGSSRHQRVIVAGPWSFPAPSLALPVTRWTFEGTDGSPSFMLDRLAAFSRAVPAPVVFAPLQSCRFSPRSVIRPPLLGFVRPGPPPAHRCASCFPATHHPSIDMLSGVHSQRNVATAPSAPGQPDQKSRSDLVVSHHLAGLLRRLLREENDTLRCLESRGLVASRYRSWGSPRFQSGHPVARPTIPFPRRYAPLEGFHPIAAVPCHHGPCLPDVHSPRSSRLQGSRFRSHPSACIPHRTRLQGFALRSGPYHRAPLPTPDGLPSRGLLCSPSRSFVRCTPACAVVPRWTGGPLPRLRIRPDRPCSYRSDRRAPVRTHRREAMSSGRRVAPVSPSSPRSRAVSSQRAQRERRARGAPRASRTSRIVTGAG